MQSFHCHNLHSMLGGCEHNSLCIEFNKAEGIKEGNPPAMVDSATMDV